MVALTCTIGTDVTMGTVWLTTALWSHAHVTLANFQAVVLFGRLWLHALQLHCRWSCLCYAYIMCVHADRCSLSLPLLIITMTLVYACLHLFASAYVSISCASAYVSTASAHTSKLPPRGSVVLNTMMQCSQLQAASGDQSDGSSNMSALRVKLINSLGELRQK